MDVSAKIKGIKYTPFLQRSLNRYDISDIDQALERDTAFILEIPSNNQIALSWWVSPKRTRSYPYARVYDTLSFNGKRVTIIPVLKDEGKDGDRDFLQWDTISLMSLLGIYVIIGYYEDAKKSQRFKNKITKQVFSIQYIKEEMIRLLSYQSDPLHWNLFQTEKIVDVAEKALSSYKRISRELRVEMHSLESAKERIKDFLESRESFISLSRKLAKEAQYRESRTVQPKERLSGSKATLTIENYLGGAYYFTCDEIEIEGDFIYLIEGKHAKRSILPSISDIKDGLLKMILLTNLEEVTIDEREYSPGAVLKLTSDREFSLEALSFRNREVLRLLKEESEANNFTVTINGVELERLINK